MKKSMFLSIFLGLFTQLIVAQSNHSGTGAGLQNPDTRLVKNFNASWVNLMVKSQLMSPEFFEKLSALKDLEAHSGLNASLGSEDFESEANNWQSEEIIRLAAGHIEKYEFETAQKILGRHVISNPNNDLARYLLGLTQLSRGFYGPAASNFSRINYRLAASGAQGLEEFRDDVRFYYAVSVTMIPGGRHIAKTLFKQLNYEGSAYKSICREMADLL